MFKIKIIINILLIVMASSQHTTDSPILMAPGSRMDLTPDFVRVPKMVIFELEHTLWPSWFENHVTPPFSLTPLGDVVDSRGSLVEYYPETPQVLAYLYSKNISMSIASRTTDAPRVGKLIDLFGWNKYFVSKQLSYRRKSIHLQWISRNCDVQFQDMLLFDDAHYSDIDARRYNVVTFLVFRGVTMKLLMQGLRKFADVQMRNEI